MQALTLWQRSILSMRRLTWWLVGSVERFGGDEPVAVVEVPEPEPVAQAAQQAAWHVARISAGIGARGVAAFRQSLQESCR